MSVGGYAPSTRRWNSHEVVKLLRLIVEHKHKWKRIKQEFPDRSVAQMRNWWWRYRKALSADNASGRRPMRCRKCGQNRLGHVCPHGLDAAETIDALELTLLAQPQRTVMGKCPEHRSSSTSNDEANNNTIPTRRAHLDHPTRLSPPPRWAPTPPTNPSGTREDFQMLMEFVATSGARTAAVRTTKGSKETQHP